jgi:D-3-phosphoglycerate dehydrogenase
MWKIRTLNDIAQVGLDRFPRDGYTLSAEEDAPEAIVVRSASMHELPVPDSLLAVGRAGAGVNNIPVDKMSGRGVVVFNAPGANANAVKELVIAGMLLAARHICQAWDFVRGLEGGDEELHKAVEAGKKRYKGFELPGRVLGVVGLGAIGVQVANAAMALGMRVIGFDPEITVEGAWKLSSDVEQAGSLDEVLQGSDFISFHVPLNDQTRGMLNADNMSLLRAGSVVMNFARHGIVSEEPLLKALQDGKIGAYVTDFPSNAMQGFDGVISLPHLGASTREAEENCAMMVADQIRDYLENGNIRNSVNFPNMRMQRAGAQRVCVANSNVPDMVAKISHELGKASLNIIHMRNESRGNYAYTVADVEKPVPEETRNAIESIEGVLKLRVI